MGNEDSQHVGPLPIDLVVDDLQQDVANAETDSVSSVAKSAKELGRTYHEFNQGKYFLPNDDAEQDRLDLQHRLFSITFDGHLSLAPVENPQIVLDIGTGTGIWAVEYAMQSPASIVTGIDLSPVSRKSVPPNCHFLVADVEAEWTYPSQFNYIHGRALCTCFRNPLYVFQSAFASLAPGGYFEMQEIYFRPHSNDNSTHGTALEAWNTKLVEGAKILGKDWWCAPKYKMWFEEAGFVDVEEKVFSWPGNEWAKGEKQKELGRTMFKNSMKGLSAISMMVLTKAFGMSAKEVEAMLVNVIKDMGSFDVHDYYPIHVVFGRKAL